MGEIAELPGAMVDGSTPTETALKAKTLALRVIAEEIEHGETKPDHDLLRFSVAGFQEPEPAGSGLQRRERSGVYWI
jgi:predicted RNase H-like HicB family nuclease